ncbi:MAG: RHS repeat-associated core domain-containing protein, partial [Clostridia bacterium]|nr:RHS repeat-associated core domain-containing protein [Clostridia bacterium]
QFEYNAAPNSYNHISDSSFDNEGSWTLNNAGYAFEGGFTSYRSLKITGDIDTQKWAKQAVTVKSAKETRETFKLSGWANGYALPTHDGAEQNPTFRLRAVINYTDGTTTEKPITADFCPYTSGWQYTSVEFSKDAFKEVNNIEVFCDYDYNYKDAFFDNVELIRTNIETGLSEEDFTVEEDYTDESGTTTEDDQTTNDTTEETETNGFSELVDAFGNTLTETTFTDGEFGTIYRSFGYDEEGNNLVKETDARGYTTEYVVDKTTSQNKEVIDRLGNKTAYEYDQSGRTTKVTSKNAENREMASVSYAYNALDNLTEIVRGDGLKYVLKYNAFNDLESIGIDGKEDGDLITYTYKTGSGRLTSMTYANGDKMNARYDGQGNMIAEEWLDKEKNQIAYYKYGYNAQGEIVITIDKLAKKMYNYTYDNGRIEQAVESDIDFSDNYGLVDSKTVISTIRYTYDNEGTLTKKRIITQGGEQVITYTTAENDSQMVKTTVGEHSFVSTSKNDSFGRKEFDELQLGSGFVSRQFDYLNGNFTSEHKDNSLLKSTPTTQLVSEITFSDGRTIDYEYDAEERITKVTDSVEGVTRYTYDSLGQLLTETKNGQLINSMIYDRYGNILHKNGIDYGYNGIWKDRLTHYDGKEITYDAQGNPLKYLDHILYWEKGRQLKSFDNSVYTYNANGIRTSKTISGIRHDFHLDGAKILKETWVNNTLETVFDNEDSVCGIVYNGEPFYFQKNLQGDIIAITDQNANVVARYSYDAWGKCTITFGTNGVIAHINPFRYRGYYYDTETGLYYLQSRYYDPVVGRFVNGDMPEIAVFEQSVLGHNLFGYCNNSPILSADYLGTDAIILQSKESVFDFGHMGLLFQYNKSWYYWYWGMNEVIASLQYAITALRGLGMTFMISIAGYPLLALAMLSATVVRTLTRTVLAKAILKKVCSNKTITYKSALSDINNKLKKVKAGYAQVFERGLFIKGDFSKSYKYLKTQKTLLAYNLIYNNCMQTSISALHRGKFKSNNTVNHFRLVLARGLIVPNFAYDYLSNYFTAMKWSGRR